MKKKSQKKNRNKFLHQLDCLRMQKMFETILVILGICIFTLLVIKHRHFFFVPNTDIYQYLCEAREYYRGMLPAIIHPQPLYSILIYPISWFFRSVEFPEFSAGIAINIAANTIALFCFYFLSKRGLGTLLRLLLLTFLLTHPLFFYTSVNTTPEPMLLLFVTLSLFFFRSKPQFAYLFAVMAAFVKYEGFILLGALFITSIYNYYRYENDRKITLQTIKFFIQLNWIAIISVLVLGFWTVSTTLYNLQKIGTPNFFITEIVAANNSLPDWRKTTRVIDLLRSNNAIFNTNYINMDMFEFVLLLSILLGTTLKAIQSKNQDLIQSVFFVGGYLLVHTFFPAYNPRYFLPVLPFLFYFCLILIKSVGDSLNQLNSKFFFIVILLLSFGIVFDLVNHQYSDFLKMDQYLQAGKRLGGEWLNDFSSDQDITVISNGEKQIMSYIESSNVKYPFSSGNPRPLCDFSSTHRNSKGVSISYLGYNHNNQFKCADVLCLIHSSQITSPKILVLQTDNSNMRLSNFVSNNDISCFTPLYESHLNESYTKIYEFNNNCRNVHQSITFK